jgi:hypothetical protein
MESEALAIWPVVCGLWPVAGPVCVRTCSIFL